MELRIHGQVTAATCRTTTDGRPLIEVELKTPDGQAVHAKHIYPEATASNSHAAMTLARQLKGQQAELYATNPRFTWQRMDCLAQLIRAVSTASPRKDLA
ncbi:hypothetical protein [Delftia sp. WSY_7]|uniref:hypothetical protein n=1 Tax=Delftia sp. WSY_7 TaxID=3367202 RepID=UPI00370C5D99